MHLKISLIALLCLAGIATASAQVNTSLHLGTRPHLVANRDEDEEDDEAEREKGHEGIGAINYWKKLEERIREMNRRNGVRTTNRTWLRYKAWKDAYQVGRTNAISINGLWGQVSQAASSVGMGRIERIAFHPSNPNIFYLGTAGGGLWYTGTGGSSYIPLTDGLATGGVAAIAIDNTTPTTLYIATGSGLGGQSASSIGVLKSYDGGNSFEETGLKDDIGGVDPLYIYDLKMSPYDHNMLYAGTNRGLYRTTNGGATWSVVLNQVIFDIAFHPTTPTIVYASSYNRIFFSPASGQLGVWSSSALFTGYPTLWTPNSYYASKIAVSANDPSKVFIASAIGIQTDSARNVDGDVYLIAATYNTSTNSMTLTTPKKVNNCTGSCIRSGGGRYYGDIYVSSTNANNIMIGGLETFSTANGGTSWVTKSFKHIGCTTGNRNFHVDIGSVSFNNGQLYVTTDGGVYRQTDGNFNLSTSDWADITAGIEITQSYTHDGSPQDAEYYLYANQDNNVHLRTNFSSYTSLIGGDGTSCKFDKTDKQIYYGSIQNGEYLYRFDHGTSTYITPGAGSGDEDENQYSGTFNYSKAFMLDENVSTTLYAAKRNFYKSTNKGTTWTIKDVPGATSPQSIMRVAKSNSNVIYMMQENGTFRSSTNGGNAWNNLTTALPANIYVSDIGVDPDASGWVYLTSYGNVADKKVFLSKNGGASFAFNLSAGLPNVDVRCIKVVGGAMNEVYVGTDVGVYYRNDNIGHWVNFSNGLPITQIMSLYVNPGQQTISAGTFGRGIWVSSIYGAAACPTNLTLNATYYHRYVYSASGAINTTGLITGDANTHIKFSGGTSVTMSPGFVAEQNTDFKAVIEGCNPSAEPLRVPPDTATNDKATSTTTTKSRKAAPAKTGKNLHTGKIAAALPNIIIGAKKPAEQDTKMEQ